MLDIGEPADQAPTEIREAMENSRISQKMRSGDDSTVFMSVYPTEQQWQEYRESRDDILENPHQDAERISGQLAERLYQTMV